jgi:hypothetical protein
MTEDNGPTVEPGIYADLSEDEYHHLRYFSNSVAGKLLRCPALAKYQMECGEETEALRWGSMFHKRILEPDQFDSAYITGPNVAKNTKKWKEFLADIDPDDTRQPIKESEAEDAAAIERAVWSDPVCKSLLSGKGRNEVSIIWDRTINVDGQTHQVRCKGRLDRLTAADGYSAIVDLKSTQNASTGEFSRSCGVYGYHRQAAMYLDGCAALDILKGQEPKQRRYIFIAVEKAPPFAVGVYELDDESIRAGRSQYVRLLEQWQECVTLDQWPSYTGWNGGIETISVPQWAL